MVVCDEKIISAEMFDTFDGVFEGVGGAKVVDGTVEILASAIGFFDFECIKGIGVDDAEDFVVGINDWKVSKARFIKFVESKRAEDLGVFNEDHFGAWNHEVLDDAVVETHDGGDTITIFVA